jgi:hypothetical protein
MNACIQSLQLIGLAELLLLASASSHESKTCTWMALLATSAQAAQAPAQHASAEKTQPCCDTPWPASSQRKRMCLCRVHILVDGFLVRRDMISLHGKLVLPRGQVRCNIHYPCLLLEHSLSQQWWKCYPITHAEWSGSESHMAHLICKRYKHRSGTEVKQRDDDLAGQMVPARASWSSGTRNRPTLKPDCEKFTANRAIWVAGGMAELSEQQSVAGFSGSKACSQGPFRLLTGT